MTGVQTCALPISVLCEFAPRAEQLRAVAAAHEREPLPLDERLRNRLPVQFDELGLVIEQLQLARPARHEQVDDVLGPRRKVRRLGRERIRKRGIRSAECGVGGEQFVSK